WKRWARGHDTSADRLAESAAVMHRMADGWRQDQLGAVAVVVDGWIQQSGLDIPLATPEPQRPSLGQSRGLGLQL
ncbi:MAG: hypothetical protein M3Q82_09535, partial [Actinomycetota bacterium]|nr:hypothetical protein [Actinomycetota bacterium]